MFGIQAYTMYLRHVLVAQSRIIVVLAHTLDLVILGNADLHKTVATHKNRCDYMQHNISNQSKFYQTRLAYTKTTNKHQDIA